MAVKKVTGIAEVDSLLAGMSKKFGHDVATTESFNAPEAIPTGAGKLDRALGIGGVARGRIIEVIGEPSGGKTSLCFQIVANAQALRAENGSDRIDLVIDLEHTITDEFMRGFGVDTDKVLHVRPTSAEEALQLARDLPKTGKIDMVVFDSVAAGQSLRQQKRDIGEADVGGISKLMQDAVRSVSKTCERHDTTYLFINQVTYKVGIQFGDPRTTPGGQALKYFSTQRLMLLASKPSPGQSGAFDMRVRVTKNKCAPPYYDSSPITFPFFYGKGCDRVMNVMSDAKELGLINHSAGRSKICWNPLADEPVTEYIAEDMERGKEAAITYVREHPEMLARIEELIKSVC